MPATSGCSDTISRCHGNRKTATSSRSAATAATAAASTANTTTATNSATTATCSVSHKRSYPTNCPPNNSETHFSHDSDHVPRCSCSSVGVKRLSGPTRDFKYCHFCNQSGCSACCATRRCGGKSSRTSSHPGGVCVLHYPSGCYGCVRVLCRIRCWESSRGITTRTLQR